MRLKATWLWLSYGINNEKLKNVANVRLILLIFYGIRISLVLISNID